jgi:hypothetical protein
MRRSNSLVKFHLLSAIVEETSVAYATNDLAVGPAIEKSPRANDEAAYAENGPSLHIASVVVVAAMWSRIPAKTGFIGWCCT